MATWQERMQEAADQAYWQVTLSGACGWCVDEGERVTDWIGLHPVMNRLAEDRPAEFHYSRLDALDVVRAGYLGAYAADDANSKSVKLQGKVADFLASPESAKAAGVKVVADIPVNKLGKAEFFARRARGVEQLKNAGFVGTHHEVELEWMKREAEVQTGYLRDDPHPLRKAKWKRAYRTLCNRDRKQSAT